MRSKRPVDPVKNYVDQVAKRVKFHHLKKQLRIELHGHIQKNILRLQNEGTPPEPAAQFVLRELGDARDLADEYLRKHYPVKWMIFSCMVFFSLLLVTGLLLYSAFLVNEADKNFQNYEQYARIYLKAYLRDLDTIKGESFYKLSSRHKKDAGEYLNDKVPWTVINLGKGRVWPGPLAEIKAPLSGRVDWSNWRSEYRHTHWPEVSIGWISHLEEFDHWDIYIYGPQKDLLTQPGDFFSTTQPEFNQIFILTEYRLLKSLGERKPLKALHEVHHLAQLIQTTETMVGSAVAASILKLEHKFVDIAVKEKMMNRSDFKLVPMDIILKARRSQWATIAFMKFGVISNRDIYNAIFNRDQLPPGICLALNESLLENRFLKNSNSGPLYPMERDLGPYFLLIDDVKKRARDVCRLTYYNSWKKSWPLHSYFYRPKSRDSFSPQYWKERVVAWSYQIPYVRRSSSLYQFSFAVTSFPEKLYEPKRIPITLESPVSL